MTYLNSYEITLTMENGQNVIWEGYAEDQDHAEGLAIEYAKRRTSEQVDHIDELNEFDQFEVITEYEASERYDEMIDECAGDVSIFGMTYCASRVLKEVDPIAYNCGFSDYVSQLESEDHILVEGFYCES